MVGLMLKVKSSLVVLLVILLWSFSFADSSVLVGDWMATRPDGATTTWHFQADGTMSAEFDGMEGFKGTWKLDTSQKPHALDVIADGDSIETIIEFKGADAFRMEIGTVEPGEPRPKTFSDMAVTFNKQ
jgi:uncharacterized protein (TIGR03067 family)